MLYASQSLMEHRHSMLRKGMKEAGYKALLIVGNSEPNQRGYVRYVSDWRLFGGTAYVIFPLEDQPILIMGLGAQAEWARELSAIPDTRPVLNKNEALLAALKERGLEKARLGAVGWKRIIPAGDAAEIATGLPGMRLEDATGLMESVMMTLSAEELAQVEETHGFVVKVLERIAKALQPGRTERDVLAEGIHEAALHGCLDGMAHIGTGQASRTMPGSDRRIGEGDIIKLFLEFAGPSGFLVELGAVLSFTQPPEIQQRKFDTYVRAMERAAEMMRPGNKVSDLCLRIKETFEEDGLKITGRRLWDFHGQGLHSILPPLGMPDSDETLNENSMINIHPGILTEDGIGVSATHNYIVTSEGGRALGAFKPRWLVLNP